MSPPTTACCMRSTPPPARRTGPTCRASSCPNLFRLADNNYPNNHRYYVDGSPESADVYINGDWRTILVGGLNKGGRGYYALDITDPADPQVLWEFCSDAALCAKSDADLGYTYGNPVITKRPSDGKWVVIFTSGYNNVSPGDGKGYFYVVDAADGTLLNKVGTNVGDTTTPSGLARITGLALNAQTNNTVTLCLRRRPARQPLAPGHEQHGP